MAALSLALRDALKWLEERGGDGVFADRSHQVLIAHGESAPFMRSTWNRLRSLGRVEFYGNPALPDRAFTNSPKGLTHEPRAAHFP